MKFIWCLEKCSYVKNTDRSMNDSTAVLAVQVVIVLAEAEGALAVMVVPGQVVKVIAEIG